MKKHYLFLPLATLSIIGANLTLSKERNCDPEPSNCYNKENCLCTFCLGPTEIGTNPAVRPKTCNGDIIITGAALYWNASQDGEETSLLNNVTVFPINPTTDDIQQLNNLVSAEYKQPAREWSPGFKFGLGYVSACDGWDVGVIWTYFQNFSSKRIEADPSDHQTLIPLWSAFVSSAGEITFARDIRTYRLLKLNLVDVDLGREFWTSKYLSFRPFIGFRYSTIEQKLALIHRSGSWSARTNPNQLPFASKVNIKNDFKGFGLRAGFDTIWNLGCGWAFQGNLASSIIYGRFHINHKETNRETVSPFSKMKTLKMDNQFRTSRTIFDLS